jgi:putative peptidoglycan lipid II flippase
MSNALLKSGSRLTLMTLGSRVLGLIREMTKAAFLGTTALSDAFTVAFMIPNLLRRLFAENSVSVAFIPTFSHYLEAKKKEETKAFLSAIFTFMTFVTTVTVIIGIIATPLIVSMFKTGSDETVLLTRIMFPYLAVISIAALFQGILNGVKIFSPSGFTPILFNAIIIACTYLLSPRMANPARAMAVGVLAGGLAQVLFQIPFLLKEGFRFSFVPLKKAFADPGTRTVLRLIGPTIVGMAVYQLNDLVSTLLAGYAGQGVASSLTYSLRMQELILGLFVVSIGTVILPDLTERATRNEWDAFNRLLAQAMNIIALITIPVTLFSLVTGEGLITLLYRSRNFGDESVTLTLRAFSWHIAGLYFIGVNRVVAPAFYAQSDTKSPVKAGIVSFGVNIVLAIALSFPMKGGGIALALSVASAANTVCLMYFLRKKETIDVPKVLRSSIVYALKMLALSAIAAVPIVLLKNPLNAAFAGHHKIISQGVPIAVSAAVFGLAGLALLALTRDPVAGELFSAIRRKTKK